VYSVPSWTAGDVARDHLTEFAHITVNHSAVGSTSVITLVDMRTCSRPACRRLCLPKTNSRPRVQPCPPLHKPDIVILSPRRISFPQPRLAQAPTNPIGLVPKTHPTTRGAIGFSQCVRCIGKRHNLRDGRLDYPHWPWQSRCPLIKRRPHPAPMSHPRVGPDSIVQIVPRAANDVEHNKVKWRSPCPNHGESRLQKRRRTRQIADGRFSHR
jgi:hypothetical protein